MRIYPAIDIKNGECVRLLQGRFDAVTVYFKDPVSVAREWEKQGGEYIHVVDLDGALKGHGVNSEIIKRICSSVNVPVQTGGGIRTMDDIKAKLDCGIERVIIGTSAVKDAEFVKRAVDAYKEKIVIGIDAKDGYVAVDGWEQVSNFKAEEFALKMKNIGVETIVYTDIATDGTLKGPNIDAMKSMAEAVDMDVIASGGVGKTEDILNLANTGVEGVIVGRALYTGDVELKTAINKLRSVLK